MRKGIITSLLMAVFCVPVLADSPRGADTIVRSADTISRSTTTTPTLPRETAAAPLPAGKGNRPVSPITTAVRTNTQSVVARTAITPPALSRETAVTRATTTARTAVASTRPTTRAGSQISNLKSPVSARAATTATTTVSTADTATGAAYDTCKGAYFACMDQFCAVKNTDFARCSCSDRVFDMIDIQNQLSDAGNQLTSFNENLDIVGMTANQAVAMKNATEGEDALTADKSASKALLNAIMASINGDDATVSGKYSALNPIVINPNSITTFGFNSNDGQTISQQNGTALYNAVYGQCSQAVASVCPNAALQRAVTAYQMAVENDCNTVAGALSDQKQKFDSSVASSGAMLQLARVQNHQETNSSDATTCIDNVAAAITDENVCGKNYHKCLDNGQYIDVTTGTPILGVVDFYKLASLLKFNTGQSIPDQKLSQIPANKTFVDAFVAKTKQYAEPALSKCSDIADSVWSDYLDSAMLAIYYAQTDEVNTVKTGCMDFVSACYMNGDTALTQSMQNILGSSVMNQPDFIATSDAMCKKYVDSCDNMFNGDGQAGGIIAQYVNDRTTTDLTTACNAIVQQCFDQYGGDNYENFFNPNNGVITRGQAFDWFTFAEYNSDGTISTKQDHVSECARELLNVASCNPPDQPNFARDIFGGFIYVDYPAGGTPADELQIYLPNVPQITDQLPTKATAATQPSIALTGIASITFNKIIGTLTNNCSLHNGIYTDRFTLFNQETQCWATNQSRPFVPTYDPCHIGISVTNATGGDDQPTWVCPQSFMSTVDQDSWGYCMCFDQAYTDPDDGLTKADDVVDMCRPQKTLQDYCVKIPE